MNFQSVLKAVLTSHVKVVDGGKLKVDDFLYRLRRYQEIHFLESDRKYLLHEVSMLFGKQITLKGKKKE